MRFNRLDLNLLVALDVLLAEQNVSRASERLHLSQSATSGALAKLRDYFNDELLIPGGRQMTPTPFGASLAVPVRQLLQQISATVELRPGFDPQNSQRELRLMVSDYVTTVFIAEVVRRAHRAAPGLRIALLPHTDAPTEALERGDVDFLVIPANYVDAGQRSAELFHDTYLCVVASDNDLIGEQLDWQQYLQLGHVVVRLGRAWTPVFDEWFLAQYGHARRIEVTTGSFLSVAPLVVGTNRIATLHRRLAELVATTLPLRLLSPPMEFPIVRQVLQWNGRLDNDPAAHWLRELMLAVARELPDISTR